LDSRRSSDVTLDRSIDSGTTAALGPRADASRDERWPDPSVLPYLALIGCNINSSTPESTGVDSSTR
jgi:hypothetical protein